MWYQYGRYGRYLYGLKLFKKRYYIDCLAGLVFVLTGVYESLEREEMTEIIKKYGGKVTTSLSRNTTYLGSFRQGRIRIRILSGTNAEGR